MFRPSMLGGLIAGMLAISAPANGTVLAFAPDDGTDYSAHIILVTGKPLPNQEICETDVQMFQVVLLSLINRNPTVVEMGILDTTGAKVSAGSRFVADWGSNCDDATFKFRLFNY